MAEKKVKIYTTPKCPYCKMAKDYLRKKGVKFEEIDVSSDQKAAEEMIKKSGQIGVPQIEINGRMILGFDEAALEKELSKK
jgi:glutaredoxin-like YruB-family protein